jgi:hypothetical protein
MHAEETKDKKEKTRSTDFGFIPSGHGLSEMMNKCCTGQGGFSACSTMMKGMMDAMKKQPCCASEEDTQFEEKKK